MTIQTIDNGIYILNTMELENEEVFSQAYYNCSDYRQKKIDKMRFDKDKRLSLAVGILMDYGLKKYGMQEKDRVYITLKEGKPQIEDHPEIHFNASHSGVYAAVGFSESEIGLDLQEFCKFKPGIAKRFFANSEYEDMMRLPEDLREKRFFRLWVLKEAYIKYTGRGMQQPLDSFFFAFDKKDGLIQDDFSDCYFKEYIPCEGYRLAVCRGNH